jgi:tRNA threonylcarbamoyladenosine biosynthesis protein TsaE
MKDKKVTTRSPDETFAFGEEIGRSLEKGDLLLLYGGLGAGKTLLAKGVLKALNFDVDDVTSPSFSLVNLYETAKFDVYHIDLWRLNGGANAGSAVGLDEILENENAVTIIEWADRLGEVSVPNRTFLHRLEGDGDEPREIQLRAYCDS